jgi:hypothetical protein
MKSDQVHNRAEALFKKEQRLREGQQAMAEYRAELHAMREKTARLRALRLARDGAKSEDAARKQEGRGVKQDVQTRTVMRSAEQRIGPSH